MPFRRRLIQGISSKSLVLEDLFISVLVQACCGRHSAQKLQLPRFLSSSSSQKDIHPKPSKFTQEEDQRVLPKTAIKEIPTKSAINIPRPSKKMNQIEGYLEAMLSHRLNPKRFLKSQPIRSNIVGEYENRDIPPQDPISADIMLEDDHANDLSPQLKEYYRKYHELAPIRMKLIDLTKSWHSSVHEIWDVYQHLPYPRAQFLERWLIRRMVIRLLRMSKGQAKLSRFMSIMGDLRVSSIPIRVSEWTGFITILGTSFEPVGKTELDAALQIWKQMESTGIKADISTFNALISVATKAKSWYVVNTILSEIRTRGLVYDRYTWCSCFVLKTLQKDLPALISVFRNFQQTGDIVDTVILNAIISGLIYCGDPSDVHRFYRRMFLAATTNSKTPRPRTVEEKRVQTKMLIASRAGHPLDLLLRISPTYQIHKGEIEPVAPDIVTYSILLHYYCIRTGDFQAVGALLQDMETLDISPNESIFSPLFRGFSLRGSPIQLSSSPSEWSRIRLEYCFDILISQKSRETVRLNKMLVIWIIRSFKKIQSDKIETVWKAVDAMWEEQGADIETRRPVALVCALKEIGIAV
ncbi:Pentatricopeptide repeat-containing protein [Neolecta irregularis DAH-3]|uniref:Pentatricopeptide repeat-containing protein n=1 Tax=Neolecta irregularis (strain DAH-3) TaxID=1198029 RepID=A0A1U7LIU9_NEOID|nr:Pentatricopeptide repeat-containing protein [Neolecta irregularis DAH-3]|eukprot:OLL22577.1 Pentatricopeptide repeat-containing protein [Neolecta irregularis DAH-3]